MKKLIQNKLRWRLIILFSCLSGYVHAHDFEVDGIYYIKTSDNEVSVTYRGDYYYSYNEYTSDVVIPETVTYNSVEYSVTTIGEDAFYGCSGLTSVTIPNSVTSIGNGAFLESSGLTSVTIPNSVTSIGEDAFNGCSGLTSVSIPNSVTTIGEDAFSHCSGLTSVNISDIASWCKISFESSDANPLYYAQNLYLSGEKLENLIIPESVTSIKDYAFYGCSGLTSVTIGNSVTSIGGSAFYCCSGLTSLTIPNSVTSIGGSAFYGCSGLTSVTIGKSVTSIGNWAFDGCSSIKELKIEDGDETLSVGYSHPVHSRKGLFFDCPLEKLYLGRNLSYEFYGGDGQSPFRYKTSLKELTVGNSVTSIDQDAFYGCSGLTSVTIGKSVTSIGNYAFNGCTGIKEIKFEDGDETLSLGYNYYLSNWSSSGNGEGLFYDCPIEKLYLGRNLSYKTDWSYGYSPFYDNISLTELTIGNSVTSVSPYAFHACSGLISVTIGNSVTYIGSEAFYGCSGLTSLTIPASVTSIRDGAFYGCTSIKEITIEDGEDTLYLGDNNAYGSYSYALFSSCPLKKLYLGRNLSYDIDDDPYYAPRCAPFYEKTSLTELTIGNSVSYIRAYAFYGCSGLTSVTIPNSVTSIGNYVFNGCTAIKEITFEDGEETLSLGYNSLYEGLFYDCPLEKLYLGRNLLYETSGRYGYPPFYGKDNLTELAIGNSVTSIGSSAFSHCSGLTSVTIPNSVTSIGSSAFRDCSGLTSVTIGSSVTSIGGFAFRGCSGLTSIVIPNSVTTIGDDAFSSCSGLTSVTIGNSVTSIGSYAFDGCSELTSVSIGNSVTSIGYRAFDGCSGLRSVTCLATTPPSISDYTFDTKVKQKATLSVPAESVNSYKNANVWKDFYNIQTITSGIDEIIADMDEGMDSDAEVDIYTLNGTHVYKGPRSEARLAKGFYLVRQGGAVAKVYVE